MAETTELLFFDTFSHECSEELNLDLVQFPKPVFISEVRIIPLGARVQADFPGGVRLGATNPSQFDIEFFVNDLSKPGASTFESLGGLEYRQNVNIQLECDRRIPTDGLVLRGWYTTITLAVYGVLTKSVQEPPPPPPVVVMVPHPVPVPPPGPLSDPRVPAEVIVPNAATAEWVQQHAQLVDLGKTPPRFIVEPNVAPDPYSSGYTAEPYHPQTDYPPHSYREEWPQQPRPVIHQNQHGPAEPYEAPKDPRPIPPYEGEPLPWDNPGTLDEKLPWERDRGKERDRDRDRERDRDRDRERDRERERERHRDRERERERDREHGSRERDRDRERDFRDRERETDREWEGRGRREERERDRERERSNSSAREYCDVSRERDWERGGSGSGTGWGGQGPTGRRERSPPLWNDRNTEPPPPPIKGPLMISSEQAGALNNHHHPHHHHDGLTGPGSLHRHLPPHHNHDMQKVHPRERRGPPQHQWELQQQQKQQRSSSQEHEDLQQTRKRPRTPPPQTPPNNISLRSPKRPHTPPPPQQPPSISTADEKQTPLRWPPPSMSPPSRNDVIEVKKDISSPTLSSGAQPKFDSLSPGDVESISEGEIPETEADLDVDSAPIVETSSADVELISLDLMNSSDNGISIKADSLTQSEQTTSVTAKKTHPATPPPLPSQHSPISASIIKISSVSPLVNPASPPLSTLCRGGTPVDLPSPPDDHGVNVEQFEPILSDEEIVDETDSQFQDMEYDFDESDEPSKNFNPFALELQPLMFLGDPSLSLCEIEEKRLERLQMALPSGRSVPVPKEAIRLEELLLVQGKGYGIVLQNQEEWVHLAEMVPQLLIKGLPYITNHEDAIGTLIKWVHIGLDFNLALNQPQPGYKVRHMKAGIRLVDALCHCGQAVVEQLLLSIDIHSGLFNLYHRDYMAVSVKLMILHALDASLCCQTSVEHFLGRRCHNSNNKYANGYLTLLNMIQSDQLARVKFAISSLLRKLHAYEMLEKLNDTVKQLIDMTPPPVIGEEETDSNKSITIKDSRRNGEMSPESILPGSELSDRDLETIILCLEEVLKVYRGAELTICQPKQFLPVSSQFEINISREDPYPALYAFFECHRLLESCLILLTCPATLTYSSITVPVQEILHSLLECDRGMLYLASNVTTTTTILRVLLQQAPPASPGPPDDGLDDGGAISPAPSGQQLGLYMAYQLQVLQYIDSLMDFINIADNQQTFLDQDQTEVFEKLHGMYSLGLSNVGKLSLAHVLGRDDNITPLLYFFTQQNAQQAQCLQQNYQLNSIKLKSPGRCYAADLIVLTVKYSDYVPLLKRFGKRILDVALMEEQISSCKLMAEIIPWLKPIENPSAFAYDDVGALSEIVKRNIDNATLFPGELITAIRVLKFLGIPPNERDLICSVDGFSAEDYVELKYKYVILQLFSLEGMSSLVSILQKLCDYHEQPTLHSTNLVGHQGALLVALVLPSVQLIRRMLTYVIRCRNTEFKDLTAVPVLLQTYTLMHAFPASALVFADSQRVCREIIDTLLAYTQPVSTDSSSETEALNRSLWTLMMGEVVKYVTTGPHTFVPGLLILSELLPLPLPIQTRTALLEEEIVQAVNSRKLWSAHLHSLGPSIQELIATMSGSSFQPLLQLLRRVCVQLADLAAPTALIISRGILDTVLSSMQQQSSISVSSGPSDGPCSGHTARLLNFLACLVTHASVKSAVLQLVAKGGAIKADERYPGLVSLLCAILRSPSESPSHIQAQECVVSVIQSLCDTEVTLLPAPSPPSWLISADQSSALSTPSADVYLANTLPPRDLLVTMITVMLEHISNIEHSFTTLLPTVRTFLMLTEHDYGFYHLKTCMEKKTDALWNLFVKFCTGFSKDSSDCLSTLSTSLELLRACISIEEDESGLGLVPRTIMMSVSELALVLGWNRHDIENDPLLPLTILKDIDHELSEINGRNGILSKRKRHPILCLDKLLQECCNEEEALDSLHDLVTDLIRLLEEEGNKPLENRELAEPTLPVPESLLGQFSVRPVFLVGEVDDERLSSIYWLASPPVDEADQDMEQVTCDLMDTARLYLTDFHLPLETERLYRLKDMTDDDDETDQMKKRGDEMNKYLTTDAKHKRPFIAPMRGRGFGRSVPQRGDLFRSRPPNTSRPPSLHVDDFVALEISGQQPTGPTGYNKISMRAAKEITVKSRAVIYSSVPPRRGPRKLSAVKTPLNFMDMMSTRSRGRGRVFASERGRFFGSSTPYNRRENGRGIPRGVSSMPPRVGNSRGSVSPAWPPHSGDGPSSSSQQPPPIRSFRSPELRDMRMIPRSEEKFGNRFGGRAIRGGPGTWQIKDNRERFGGPNIRGGGRREPPGRHVRSFTR